MAGWVQIGNELLAFMGMKYTSVSESSRSRVEAGNSWNAVMFMMVGLPLKNPMAATLRDSSRDTIHEANLTREEFPALFAGS